MENAFKSFHLEASFFFQGFFQPPLFAPQAMMTDARRHRRHWLTLSAESVTRLAESTGRFVYCNLLKKMILWKKSIYMRMNKNTLGSRLKANKMKQQQDVSGRLAETVGIG